MGISHRTTLLALGAMVALAARGDAQVVRLDAAALEAVAWVRLSGTWLQGGDAAADEPPNARALRAWAPASPLTLGDDWPGASWWALEIEVAPDLVGVPLAIQIEHLGAAELWIAGRRAVASGVVGTGRATTRVRRHLTPDVVRFARPGRQIVAVRYANHRQPAFARIGRGGGFFIRLGLADALLAWHAGDARWRGLVLGGFGGTFLSFALLHLLLFAFHRRIRANLDFAAFCLLSASLVALLLGQEWYRDPATLLISEPAMNVLGILWGTVALRFVYRVFHDHAPRHFSFGFLPIAAVLSVGAVAAPAALLDAVFLFMLATSVEMVRVAAGAWLERRPGARTVGVGVLLLAACFATGLLANLGVLPYSRSLGILVPFLGVTALVGSMSVYLSSAFARAHADLAAQLRRVEELSAESLAQERRLREEAVERTRLEAENARKAEELEEARNLQLSMLPKAVPQVPGLTIAAFMETATEVGGDYYDFAHGDDDTLVIAIGDATGHGMRAGTMVVATKSLFQLLGTAPDLSAALGRAARALAGMRLRRLAMALTLVRLEGRRLHLSAAGMPPVFHYRAARGDVTFLELPGMPLGGRLAFPYRSTTVDLEAGDVLLLMSDGFPERVNAAGEPFGYDRARAAYLQAAQAGGAPTEVIEHLRAASTRWAGDVPADDDVTFVVLRCDRSPVGTARSPG